ncbi:MAG: O-antigen ligase family protein [Acidobacteriota bacterium]
MSSTSLYRPDAFPAARGAAHGKSKRSPADTWGRVMVLVVLGVWAVSVVAGFEAGLLVLSTIAIAAAIFGLNRPFLGVLGITMLCTLDSISRVYLLTGGLWRWNTFNYWLLVVMLLSLPFLLQLHDTPTRFLQLLVLLFLVQLLFSDDRMTGIQHVLNVITLFGILVYLGRAARHPDVWYWIAIVNGLLAGAGSLVFYLQKANLPEANANAWAFFPLTAIFCLAVSFTLAGTQRGRWTRALLAGINALWVFLSGSRGSFLIAVLCLVFIVYQLRRTGRVLPVLAVAALLAAGLLSQFTGEEKQAVYRFRSLFDARRPMTNRTSGRSELAKGGWRIFLEHPLGVGTGAFGDAWANIENREGMSVFREGEYSQAHSGWIKTLAENGVPGIILLAAFVLSFGIIGWKTRALGLFPLGLLATVGLSLAFLADEFQAKGIWLFTAAVMTSLRRGSAFLSHPAPEPGGTAPAPAGTFSFRRPKRAAPLRSRR